MLEQSIYNVLTAGLVYGNALILLGKHAHGPTTSSTRWDVNNNPTTALVTSSRLLDHNKSTTDLRQNDLMMNVDNLNLEGKEECGRISKVSSY